MIGPTIFTMKTCLGCDYHKAVTVFGALESWCAHPSIGGFTQGGKYMGKDMVTPTWCPVEVPDDAE